MLAAKIHSFRFWVWKIETNFPDLSDSDRSSAPANMVEYEEMKEIHEKTDEEAKKIPEETNEMLEEETKFFTN
jgi:hypothetical protein